MGPQQKGFTLIELLVVIAIIGVLAGMGSQMMGYSIKKGNISAAESEIQRLILGVESFQLDHGDYPPTSMEDAYEVSGNGLDTGNESMVAHLASRAKGRTYFDFTEEYLENLDNDSLDKSLVDEISWVFGDNQLREYVDPWGNPYVYIHNHDYGREFSVTGDGKPVMVSAGQSAKTATYYEPIRFQIWSAGPDGIHENAEGDDVSQW
ncbi:MAG: type II secretion system protein [Planctomycetes bacterium]|nr:type II secretion system protein [Planctomycetota bacterium]